MYSVRSGKEAVEKYLLKTISRPQTFAILFLALPQCLRFWMLVSSSSLTVKWRVPGGKFRRQNMKVCKDLHTKNPVFLLSVARPSRYLKFSLKMFFSSFFLRKTDPKSSNYLKYRRGHVFPDCVCFCPPFWKWDAADNLSRARNVPDFWQCRLCHGWGKFAK